MANIAKEHLRTISLFTAVSVVVANMVGTGVFTSLGYQLLGLSQPFSIVALWTLGGIISFCGALAYSELGAAMPRSGGEYHYLSRIYHPFVGFLSGFVSSTVGFAAPVALAAITLGEYLSNVFPASSPTLSAASVVLAISLLHSTSVKVGSRFQNIFTLIKVALIITFIMGGWTTPMQSAFPTFEAQTFSSELLSPAFAVGLFFVSYSYSGWNAAAYLAGEIKQPERSLPRALLVGTLVVTILYVLLNQVFMRCAPFDLMRGQNDVAFFPATAIFGDAGARVVSGIITLLLLSSISSMVMAGPRVMQVMGEDFPSLAALSRLHGGIPKTAIYLQCSISLLFILTSTFEQVITYIGFTLNLFTFLTVLGVMILRKKEPNLPRPYKTWGYPVTPLLFLAFSLWLLSYGLYQKPLESALGLATLAIGGGAYVLGKRGAV
jgi:APA family basic amino acid/polyamine antiporter